MQWYCLFIIPLVPLKKKPSDLLMGLWRDLYKAHGKYILWNICEWISGFFFHQNKLNSFFPTHFLKYLYTDFSSSIPRIGNLNTNNLVKPGWFSNRKKTNGYHRDSQGNTGAIWAFRGCSLLTLAGNFTWSLAFIQFGAIGSRNVSI